MLSQAKSLDKFPLKCKNCHSTFYKTKHQILMFINPNKPDTGDFCSQTCNKSYYDSINNSIQTVFCKYCNKSFKKHKSQIKKSKSGNHFCSKSCSTTYNNTHKSTGTRSSKLEKWLHEKLSKLYPNLEILYNQKNAINSELDIYIPSLKLAFELNGIFHYEPIYGKAKLNKIQNNDERKFQACLEQGIEFCIIDTSGQKYFKEKTSQKYLKIITNLVNQKIDCPG